MTEDQQKCVSCVYVYSKSLFVNARSPSKTTKVCHYCRDSAVQSSKTEGSFRARTKAYLEELKESGKCAECGDTELSHLEFDHINPESKSFDVTRFHHSLKKIKEELKKCQILCFMCHARKSDAYRDEVFNEIESSNKETLRGRRRRDQVKKLILNTKLARGECADCGVTITKET